MDSGHKLKAPPAVSIALASHPLLHAVQAHLRQTLRKTNAYCLCKISDLHIL
jgi:hypothetical protein